MTRALAFDVDRGPREAVRRPEARPPALAPSWRGKAPERAPEARRA